MTPTTDPHAAVADLERALTPLTQSLVTAPTTATEVATATAQFTQLKAYEKLVKDREVAITKPMNEALKSVRDLFAPVKGRVAALLTNVRAGLAEYNEKAEQVLDKQRAKLERKVEAGTITPGQADYALAMKGADLGAGVIPTRTHRVVVITNPEKVPDVYWVIDEVAVRKDALAGRKIPGVEVKDETLVVKPR